MRRILIATIALLFAVPSGGARAAADCSWSTFGHDPGRSMAQTDACAQIGLTNVATLHPKWLFPAGAPVTAQPAASDGLVFVGAADGTFYAIPQDSLGIATATWSFHLRDVNETSYGKFTSSPSVVHLGGDRPAVVVGGGSTLLVLDGFTGDALATVCFDPRTDPNVRCQGSGAVMEIESSPVIVPIDANNATVLVGYDYNEGGPGRAGLISLNLANNDNEWSLTPNWKFDPEALATYTTDIFTTGGNGQGCGNVWSSPTVDIAQNLVFFATGNCSTGRYEDKSLYGGESMFALDATTGALQWCYSPRPVNSDDLDFGATPNLLPGGRVGLGGKDGTYYAFARTAASAPSTDPATACRGANGQAPAWKTTLATGWSIGGIEGTPAVGKVNGTDAVFVSNALPMPDQDTFANPQLLTTLHAINANTGDKLWDAPDILPTYGGPVYANGLVFIPNTFGMHLSVYSADLGLPVWAFPMFGPASPPAVVGDSVYIGSGVSGGSDLPIPLLDAYGVVYGFEAVVV